MRRSFFLTALAALALAGCGEASAPEGRAGSITARVYVDRDASASLTEADSLLANVGVTLTSPDGESRAGTTSAAGVVVFDDVAPGSYQLSVNSGAAIPPGTALVTNPAPSAVVSFQGGDAVVDFRYVFYPGSITGRIYREDNGTAGYQAGGDKPGPNLWVWLRLNEGGVPGDRIDSVKTDAEGAYTFARVAPGSYFLEFEEPATIDYPGGATTPVTVLATQVASGDALNPVYTGSLVLTIAEARALPLNQQVAVEGNVTVRPNTYTFSSGTTSEIWIQDATGGIAVFTVPSTAPYQLGDLLQVVGTTGIFSGQEQLTSPTVTALGSNAPVTPKTISVPQAQSLADEGRLVKVNNLTITSVPTGTGTAYTVKAMSSAGDTIQIRVATGTGITRATFTVGQRYDVTGILTVNGGNTQLKPRSTADIVPGQPVTPIGTLRTQGTGVTATVVGNVTVRPGSFTSGTGGANSEIWIQDATGGIAVFSMPTSEAANIAYGDVLEVSGTTSLFSGQLQIASSPAITRLRSGTAVTPVVQTGAQILARTLEGQLVTLPSFTVTTVGTGTSYTVTGTAADGSIVQVRVHGPSTTTGQANAGIARTDWVVGSRYSVTGVLTQFNGTAQIKPRQPSDVVLIP